MLSGMTSLLVVTGVAGSGKTTVGAWLAGRPGHFMPASLVEDYLTSDKGVLPT